MLFNTLVELQPKNAGGEEGGEAKSPSEMVSELIKDLFEDRGLKQCILNLEEIKGKLEEETKGPY